MPRIVSYIRLSKAKQATPSAIANHLFQLKKAFVELGGTDKHPIFENIVGWVDRYWNVAAIPRSELHSAGIYVDIQSGWRKAERQDFNRVMTLVKSNEIDILIVRQDRFSRDAELTIGLARTFERSRCKLFEILKWRTIDFKDPDQWAEFCNSGVGSERESRTTSRRIKYQKEFAMNQGKLLGKPTYGFRRTLAGTPEIDPELEPQCKRMVQIFFESQKSCNIAVRRIESELGKSWSVPGFENWLMSPMLRGHTPYKTRDAETGKVIGAQEVIPNTHEPLLTPEQIRRIDDRFITHRGKHSGRKNHNFFPLRRLLYCDRCSAPARINQTTDSKYGYRYINIYCTAHQKGSECGGTIQGRGKLYGVNSNGRYNRLGTPYSLAEEKVIEALQLEIQRIIQEADLEQVEDKAESIPPEETKLLKQIAKLERDVADDPDLESVLNKKRNTLRDLRRQREPQPEKEDLRHELLKLAQLASNSEDWTNFFAEMSLEGRSSIFEQFISGVFCDRVSVRVEFR